MKDSKMHTGHRQRLKDRARKHGLDDFNKYEALELLLTYPIMFKDTNEIAHVLLDTYGSLYNIVNTPREDLKKIKGIGEEAALFLNLIKDFSRIYEESKSNGVTKLNSTASCVKFFRDRVGVRKVEESFLMFMDSNNYFVKIQRLSEGDALETSITREKLRDCMSTVNATNVVLIHTHPHGAVMPSQADFDATVSVIAMCLLFGFEFKDHIIINNSSSFSFRGNNLVSGLKAKAEVSLNKNMPIKSQENLFGDILHRKKNDRD